MVKRGCRALACFLVLCGCASQEEIRAKRAAQEAKVSAQEDAKCRSYGVEPGSQEYFQCRMTFNQNRAEMAALDAAAHERRRLMLMQTGFEMMANGGR